MDQDMIATHLENLDRRLARVEQILPTLATKAELQAAVAPLATKAALETLATKEELRAAVAPLATKAALETLATKEELRVAVAPLATKDELRELRTHMDILSESQRGDIQLLAEHLASGSRQPRKE